MAVDLFRLLDIRNRQALRVEGRDGKAYRTRLITVVRAIEEDLRNVLPSNYLSTIGGPNYTIALRAYAIEFAKIRLALEDIHQDLYFNSENYCSPRADIIYQKVASLLGVDKDLQLTIFSSQEFCQFALSLVEIFFGGGTPANIKKGIELFVGEEGVVTISENFLEAKDPTSPFDISDQFGFRVDFEITENIAQNFNDIGIKLDFMLKLIKPAHTLFLLRFLFSDSAESILDNADDAGYKDSFCDHAYDDMRRYCAGVAGRDRLGVQTVQTEIEDFTGMAGIYIETTRGPLAVNALVPMLADTADVTVLVNGTPVFVTSVTPGLGIITLAAPVIPSDTVVVTYYYWFNATFQMVLNQPGVVLPGNGLEKFPATYVLNDATDHQPAEVTWQYEAFQTGYTAVLNDPTSLLLNEPSNDISDPDTGRIYGHRHVLNWSNHVLSHDQVKVDGYTHILNEDTPIVELRETYDPVWEWETEFIVPDDVGWGVAPWGDNPLGWGSPFVWEGLEITFPQWVMVSPGGKFITPMETSSTTEGEEGLLTIACDTGIQSLEIVTPFEDTFTFTEPDPQCDNDGLFIFNQSVVNGDDLLGNFAGAAGCELTQTLGSVAPFEDVSTVPSSATDDPISGVTVTGEEDKVSAWDTTGMFIMNEANLNTDALWDNEQVEQWNDEGYIMVIFGGIFHLPSYSGFLTAGAP